TSGSEKSPGGTAYEAIEGARGGSAARERKCQVLGNSGGVTVRGIAASSDSKAAGSAKSMASNGSRSGDGSSTRIWLDLYCTFSSAQHPVSPVSEVWPGEWQSRSHARNFRAGMLSN